ncbi:small heat shock protein [Pholiota conissans]|uniref:Small heat shock protein n=1 Tax=Pholiota conissans TaxID=109636 RepID=A0A9P6D554_9AGAR|nr:small heat shock protein [Pholiota conissans]
MPFQSNRPQEPFLDFERFFDDAVNARVGRVLSYNDNSNDNDRPTMMDLHENPEQNLITVTLELPGIRKEDIDIQIKNSQLTITAENKLPVEFEESGYAVREIRYGYFLRTLQLPRDVEAKDVTANMENGILRITFPQNASGTSGNSERVLVS